MRFLWFDTETTGVDTGDSAIFEIAMILVDGGKIICERDFCMNPLNGDGNIVYHEDAGKIHGVPEEEIRGYPPESEQVEKIVRFLSEAREMWRTDGSRSEKLVPAGYNVCFDIRFLRAMLERHGYKYGDYFSSLTADVFDQVKRAGEMRVLPWLRDRKLGTVADHLGVPLEKAHNALSDIRATRMVAAALHRMGAVLIK